MWPDPFTSCPVQPLTRQPDRIGLLAPLAIKTLLTLLVTALPAAAQMLPSQCGPLANAYGPYDYRTDKGYLPIVEGAHFTPEVEALIRGKGGYIGGDLDYTLRAFPNHHRALISMMRFGDRVKGPRAPNAQYDVECYFVRAVTFRPDDMTARMLFATFLTKNARKDEALKQLDLVLARAGDNPFTHYNLGLLYFDAGAHDKALIQAHRALELGFPRLELANQLKAANRWTEPVSPAAAASAPPASTAAAASSPP